MQVWLYCCFFLFLYLNQLFLKGINKWHCPLLLPAKATAGHTFLFHFWNIDFHIILSLQFRWCISVCFENPSSCLATLVLTLTPSIELVLTMLSINFYHKFSKFASFLCAFLSPDVHCFIIFPVTWFLYLMWYAHNLLLNSPLLCDSHLFIPIFIDSIVEPSSVWWQTNVLDFRSYN